MDRECDRGVKSLEFRTDTLTSTQKPAAQGCGRVLAEQFTPMRTPPLTGPVKRGPIFLSTAGGKLLIAYDTSDCRHLLPSPISHAIALPLPGGQQKTRGDRSSHMRLPC